MIKKILQRMLIIGSAGLLGLILIAGAVAVLSRPSLESIPEVIIHSPASGTRVHIGSIISVDSTTTDQTSPITSVELWELHNGQYQLISFDDPPEADYSYSLSMGWQPAAPGSYRLIIRSYNDQENAGQAYIDLIVEEADFVADEGPPDDVIESAVLIETGLETEPAFSGGEQGENDPGEPAQPTIPDIDPIPAENPLMEEVLEISTGVLFPIPAVLPTPVEIEVLDFEVNQAYLAVYCYHSLEANPPVRVPVQGSFETEGQMHWNIETYLGGQNSIQLMIPDGEAVDVYLRCYGGADLMSPPEFLGIVDVSHHEEDWHGQTIQQNSVGGSSFLVSYQINKLSDLPLAPATLAQIPLFQNTFFVWDWEGEETQIDGFRLYRNNQPVAVFDPDQRATGVPDWWTAPPCSDEYQYFIAAFKGEKESIPSNLLNYSGDNCGFEDSIISINTGDILCEQSGRSFFVKYRYGSSISPWAIARLGIRFFKDEEMVYDIHTTHPGIQHGTGLVKVTTTYNGTQAIETDGMVVYMYDSNGQFYSQSYDWGYEWIPGEPDLIIDQANVNWEDRELEVQVINDGCGKSNASTLQITRITDQTDHILPVSTLYGKEQEFIELDIHGPEAELWGDGLDLLVDSQDENAESDEDNNSYTIEASSIQRIEFYKINVRHDYDRFNDGEWRMEIHVSRIHNGVWEIPTVKHLYETWGEGEHTIDVVFTPTLEAGDTLVVSTSGYEKDLGISATDYLSMVTVYHSAHGDDIPLLEAEEYIHLGSWKAEKNIIAQSWLGDYIIYYRIILE